MTNPKVFISYSWDSQEHQEWVLKLAADLRDKFSIDVILDQFEIKAGADLTHFMESAIVQSDYVVVILTPKYKLKAEKRDKGVGYESSIISQELMDNPIEKIKYIPLLREGNKRSSVPVFMASKAYHSMTIDSNYTSDLFILGRRLYDKPPIEKPALGPIPNFNDDDFDPLIEIANQTTSSERINNHLDHLIDSEYGVKKVTESSNKLFELLEHYCKFYTEKTLFNFTYSTNHRDECAICSTGFSVKFYVKNNVINSASSAKISIDKIQGNIKIPYSRGQYFPGGEPQFIENKTYTFDLNLEENVIWKNKSEKLSIERIVKNSFGFVINSIIKVKSESFRE